MNTRLAAAPAATSPETASGAAELRRTPSLADSQLLAWILVVAFALVFAIQAAPRLTAPFGDSHDGDNAAVWGSASRAIREDGFFASRAGARLADSDRTYAHHPPLIATEVAVVETLFGEHRWSTRAPAWIGSLASIFLLFALLRAHRLRPVPSALGVVVALGSPMFFLYGSMLDTTMVGLPFALATLLTHRLAADDGRWRPLVAVLAAVTTVACWEGALLCAVVGAVDLLGAAKRRSSPRVPAPWIGLAVGAIVTGAWLWWSAGSFGPIIEQLTQRSGSTAVGRSPTDWGSFFEFQQLYLIALLSPIVLLAGIPAAVFALRDSRTRVLFGQLAVATVAYPLVLREGAINHDYWNYWLPVPFAVGAAALASWLLERPVPDARRTLVGVLVGLVGVLAVVGALPANTPALAAFDAGRSASGALADASPLISDRAPLYLAGHFTSSAPWATYETRRRHTKLETVAEVRRAAQGAPGAPVLVKCSRPPGWLDGACRSAGALYFVVTARALAVATG